ncbi:MAG: hypothetical protein QGG40_01215 [Myxococcota bacterium]|jgi:dienelactone hydrolase|nr:hypothetical protein [Myxococcota bacterium]
MSAIVFLHGLESKVDENLVPTGGKARHLRERYGADTVALDTRIAQAYHKGMVEGAPADPGQAYDRSFETPLARARAAITTDTQLIIGSSFGGAVLLRMLHEDPRWTGPSVFLAGAGVKLTPYQSLAPGVPCLLVHGTRDSVVPFEHSRQLAASSPDAQLWSVDDEHRLVSILDKVLDEAVAYFLG